MIEKHLSIFASVLVSLAFVGCGSSSDNNEKNSNLKTNTIKIATGVSVNSMPIATFDKFSINKDARYDGELTAIDADGDTLEYEIVTYPEHGTVILHENGCFTYTPNDGYQGSDSFSYRVKDEVSACAIKTVIVDVCKPTIQTPQAPSNLTVDTISTTKLKLTWDDNSDNDDGFVIYLDGKLVATTDGETNKIICGLEAGKTYNFEVKAKNEAGTSAPAIAQGTTKDVTTPPLAPTNLVIVAHNDNCVRLKWDDNSDNESAYEIYQNGKLLKTISSGCTCTLIDGLTKCSDYSFSVKAINKIGSSDSSNEVTVKTTGCEISEDKNVTVAQALKGPLSEAHFTITKMSDNSVLAEGTTTKGDGVNVDTAGLIQIPQSIKNSVASGLYVINVNGGKDIDVDDNRVWDSEPKNNLGELHAIVSADYIQNGNLDKKVNILTEVAYIAILNHGYNDNEDEIKRYLNALAEYLFKGDINGDGNLDMDDLNAYNPAYHTSITYKKIDLVTIRNMIEDGKNDELSAIIDVKPVALDLNIVMEEDTSKKITLQADKNFGYGSTYTFKVLTPPSHGSYVNGVYTPDTNYYGSDSFTYITNDGYNDSEPATVNITINNVPEPNNIPIANDQNVTLDEDTSKTITLSGTDVDGDSLTYTVVTQPSHGTYVNGVYTPTANYNGNDSFTFIANDGKVDSVPATVSIKINSVNDSITVKLPDSVNVLIINTKRLMQNRQILGGDFILDHPMSNFYVEQKSEDKAHVILTTQVIADDSSGLIYEWKDGDRVISTENFGALAEFDLSHGEHIITLTVTDPNGLSASDSTIVKVTKPLIISKDWGDGESWKEFYSYNVDAKIIEKRVEDGGDHYTNIFIYDDNGRLSRINIFDTRDSNKEIYETRTFEYDSHGNIVKKNIDWDNDGTIDRISTYTYNSSNKITSKTEYSSTTTYEYDSNGNLVKIEGDYGVEEYAYDSDNRIIRKTTDTTVTDYSYDVNGNLVGYQYKFDDHNNLVEMNWGNYGAYLKQEWGYR